MIAGIRLFAWSSVLSVSLVQPTQHAPLNTVEGERIGVQLYHFAGLLNTANLLVDVEIEGMLW